MSSKLPRLNVRIAALLLWAAVSILGSGATAKSSDAPEQTRITCADQARAFSMPSPGSRFLLRTAEDIEWLEVKEFGQQLKVSSAASSEVRLSQPLRWGTIWTRAPRDTVLSIGAVESGRRGGSFGVAAHCDLSLARDEWLTKLGSIDSRIQAPTDREMFLQLIPQLDRLGREVPDDSFRPLVAHYRALVLTDADEVRDGALAFSAAAEAWRAAGEPNRAEAAQAGETEAQYAAGNLDAVLSGTLQLSSHRVLGYFGARMLNTRCLALADRGSYEAAAGCYESATADFKRLGEFAEYASTVKNFASLQMRLGRPDVAKKLALEALAMASGPYAPMTRGRLYLLLAAIDRQKGDIASCIRHIEAAEVELLGAGSAALFWRARSQLEEARLMEQIGAYHEGYSALSLATELFSPQDSLGIRARILADLEKDTGHLEWAWIWYRSAEELFERAQLKPAAEATRLARLQLQVRMGALKEAEEFVAQEHSRIPLYSGQWSLLAAEIQMRQTHLDEAKVLLDRANEQILPIDSQVLYAIANANLRALKTDHAGAQGILLESAERMHEIAASAGNPVLTEIVEHQIGTLRRAAMQFLLNDQSSPLADEKRLALFIAPWLALSRLPKSNAAVNRLFRDEAFDAALAQEFFAPATPGGGVRESATQHYLLSMLARDVDKLPGTRKQAGMLTLGDLQKALDSDAVFIAYLDGGARGALLWATRDAAAVVAAPSPDDIRKASASLRTRLQSASSGVAEIAEGATRISDSLLTNLPGSPPRRLYVLSNEVTDGLTWSLLHWPGRSEPLIDSTAISITQLTADDWPGRVTLPATIDILVAAQGSDREPVLPLLEGASMEAEQLKPIFQNQHIALIENAKPTRSAAIDALGGAGWVHIAAHGMAQPQRIGFAGIWLEPSANDALPPFLSWLDILNAGARANLVVLNACRLGDSGNVIGANLSFAAALMRAGAQHVIAAQWPVSDSASALWVPVFYEALIRDPLHDPAQALRAAQLRLRQSRAFTHPFFWASLQTLERLPVDVSQEPAPKVARTH